MHRVAKHVQHPYQRTAVALVVMETVVVVKAVGAVMVVMVEVVVVMVMVVVVHGDVVGLPIVAIDTGVEVGEV